MLKICKSNEKPTNGTLEFQRHKARQNIGDENKRKQDIQDQQPFEPRWADADMAQPEQKWEKERLPNTDNEANMTMHEFHKRISAEFEEKMNLMREELSVVKNQMDMMRNEMNSMKHQILSKLQEVINHAMKDPKYN